MKNTDKRWLPLRSTATYELNRHSFPHLFDGFARLRGWSELSRLADMSSSASSSCAVVLASKWSNSYLILLILLSCLPTLSQLIAFYLFWEVILFLEVKWYFVNTWIFIYFRGNSWRDKCMGKSGFLCKKIRIYKRLQISAWFLNRSLDWNESCFGWRRIDCSTSTSVQNIKCLSNTLRKW